MNPDESPTYGHDRPGGLSRRSLLGGGALLAGGAVAGAAVARAVPRDAGEADGATARVTSGEATPAGVARPDGTGASVALYGPTREPFHGDHQAGILTGQQAHGAFVGLNLLPGSDRARVRTLLQLLTDDAARLTQGKAPLGALEHDIAALPARLTVTFGLGRGLFAAIGRPDAIPPQLATLPAFATDKLQPAWGQTDLVLQICSEEPVALSYAQRRLVRDAAAFATVAWVQSGFVNSVGTEAPGTTPRNLMGMRDGTANESDPARAAEVAWCTDPAYRWLVGGSHLVIRRMAIDMEPWDDLEPAAKEEAFGRRLSDGAPLSGHVERDPIDRAAKGPDGFPVVNPAAHGARAQPRTPAERILRRAYNYDAGLTPRGKPDVGLIFVCYQRDVATSFIPVQRRLAENDMLNIWATHIGSASYAVPPGVREGGYVGQSLLEG